MGLVRACCGWKEGGESPKELAFIERKRWQVESMAASVAGRDRNVRRSGEQPGYGPEVD